MPLALRVSSAKRAHYFSKLAGKDDCESDDVPRPVYLQMGKVRADGVFGVLLR